MKNIKVKIFYILVLLLKPLIPLLIKCPFAWRIRSLFFRVSTAEGWLKIYGPEFDAPLSIPPSPVIFIIDHRTDGQVQKFCFDYNEQMHPVNKTISIDHNTQPAALLDAISDVMFSSSLVIYIHSSCFPHRMLVVHYLSAMLSNPEVPLWYSDSVILEDNGNCSLFCKPGWDPLYFQHYGYVGPCFAMSSKLAKSTIKKFSTLPLTPESFFEASLIEVQRLKSCIGHIPVPLYNSTSDTFKSSRSATEIKHDKWPKVSIVIPFRDRVELLHSCLDSLFKFTDYPHLEYILVDNGSRSQKTLEFLASLSYSNLKIIKDSESFNFSRLVNRGVNVAEGEIVTLLNNDITVPSNGYNWLKALIYYTLEPQIGCVGSKLLYPNGLIQHGGILCGTGVELDGTNPPGLAHAGWPGDSKGYFGLLSVPRTVSAVSGAALAVRKDVYLDVGGFNENLAVAFNDVDFCLKLTEKGLRCVCTPESILIHHESASRKMDRGSHQKMERLRKEWAWMRDQWGTMLDQDPWYNPNLTSVSSYELGTPLKRTPRILPA